MVDHSPINILRAFRNLLLVLGISTALLFLPAGSLNWPAAWVLIAFLGLYFLLYIYWGTFKDPEQLQERSHQSENIKKWDKVILGIYTVLLPTVFVVAGFDAVRFGWSHVSLVVQIFGWVGLFITASLVFWTVTTNTYLSRYVRIQDDRGQSVVIVGPYRFIRHPMYLGVILLFLSLGPALGSLYTLIPGIIIDILFIIRTAKEDKTLHEELGGYPDYAQQVRYRLFPGIW